MQSDKDESKDYNSNDYNSKDSFIASEADESPIASSEDEEFQLEPAKKKAVRRKASGGGKNDAKNRGRRLKKMKEKVHKPADDDFVEYEGDIPGKGLRASKEEKEDFEQEENSFNQHRFARDLGEHHDLLNNIFNDDLFKEDAKETQTETETNQKTTEDFSKMLPPEEQQRYFLTEQDQKIKKMDLPERLQIRFEGRPEIVPEEMVHESRWIVKKLMRKNNLSDSFEASLEVKVYGVLENLLWKNQEIMYIWVYSRQDITSNMFGPSRIENNYELTLDDLWFIYFADQEWQKCSEMRVSLTKLMQLLEKYEEISGFAKMALDNAMDIDNLTGCYEYLKFKVKSYIDEDQIETLLKDAQPNQKSVVRMKKMKKPNRLREMREYGMDKVAYQITINPEQLAANFEENSQVNTPTLLRQRPNELSEEVSREDVGYLSRPVDTLNAISKKIAADYFFHPVIRSHLKKICNEKLYIVTKPTEKGKKTLTVYHYYYPTKRITGKRMSSIDPCLWMLIMEAEKKGLVRVKFTMDYNQDPDWFILMEKVERLLLDNRQPNTSSEKSLIKSWNQVRRRIVNHIVKIYAKPVFEKEFRKQLTKSGKDHITREIKREFKQIINIKPYRPTRQEEGGQEESVQAEEDLEVSSKILGLESVRVLACTMTSNLTSSSRDAVAVFVALNEKGHIDGILRLKNCFRKSIGMRNPSKQALYDKNIKALKDFVMKQVPKVIVISPKSLVMQGLKIELNDLFTEIFDNLGNEMMKPFVMWGDNRVAEIASRSDSFLKFIDSKDPTVCEAVSLGRYVQDPLSETLNLWSHRPKENQVLNMSLHAMQHLVPIRELHDHLESVVLEIVGGVGVNINRCFKIGHRASPLQFVSGLGPRKAGKLIQNLKTHIKDGFVGNREDLEGCGILSTNTYMFSIGFLRFYKEDLTPNEALLNQDVNLLDLTRIHPDNYTMANKMVLECLQVEFKRDDTKKNHNGEVIRVMVNPEKLQELDLIDYGNHLSDKRKSNMHWQIQFIEKELAKPFLDPREDFRTNINMVDLFYKLTNENKHVLYENALILMQVKSFDSKGLKLSTNHGIQSIISQEEVGYQLGDPDISDQQVVEKFPINSHAHVRIRKIDYIRLRLTVSLREQEISAHKEFLRNSKILEKWGLHDDSFKVYKDEDYPLLSSKDRQNFRFTQRFVPRKIRHPHFKNMPLANAQDYLKSRPQGEFVVRPSSQGNSYLNITWKIFPKVFCHLLIKEGHKSEQEVISQQLFLAKEREPYRSLDDIIESYLKPVNLLVKSVLKNQKFLFESIDKVNEKVKDSKKGQPNKIPYFFSTSQDYPQFLVLTYILQKLKVVHELIKIKPDGFIFHDQKFFSIDDLIAFFKKNLKTSEYSKFVEKNVTPSFGKKRNHRDTAHRRNDGIKADDRHGLKMESSVRDRGKYKSRHPRRRSISSDSSEYSEPWHRPRQRDYDRFRNPKREYMGRSHIKREDPPKPPMDMIKREDSGYGNRQNFQPNPGYNMGGYNNPGMPQYKRVKPSEPFGGQNVPYMSNYSGSYMNQGYPNMQMNMPIGMNYMGSQFQPSDVDMVNFTHNMNLMSANLNPYGNLQPPPPPGGSGPGFPGSGGPDQQMHYQSFQSGLDSDKKNKEAQVKSEE